MRLLIALMVAGMMTFGVGSAFAGGCGAKKSCTPEEKAACEAKKAECAVKDSANCGGCDHPKGSEECAKACAEAAESDS